MDIKTKIITAKALRTSFTKMQADLLKETFWSDKTLTEIIREMQEQYKIFESLCSEIKEENRDEYEKQILGL